LPADPGCPHLRKVDVDHRPMRSAGAGGPSAWGLWRGDRWAGHGGREPSGRKGAQAKAADGSRLLVDGNQGKRFAGGVQAATACSSALDRWRGR